MIRLALASIGLVVAAPVAAPFDAAPPAGTITVEIAPTTASVVLGDSLDLAVTVVNPSDQPTADLVVHLDITDPTSSSSVDPEDWTSTLSKPLGVVEPGGVGTVDWVIQPISPGTFSAYAVAISSESSDVVASDALVVEVADQRSLDPGGILPVVIAMPLLVGGLLVARAFAARRAGRPTAS